MKKDTVSGEKTAQGGHEMSLYLKDIKGIPLLTVQEEWELGRRIQKGDKEALKKLVESNLRFVIKIAKRYANYGIELMDLINEGNLGLIEAAKRFDPDRNVRFTSYAVWWIRQAIFKHLSDSRFICRISPKIAQINYQAATALARHKSAADSVELKDLAEEIGVSEINLKNALSVVRETTSLDEIVVDRNGRADELFLKDIIPDSRPLPDEETVKTERRRLVESALRGLTTREEKIMRLRFGFDGPGLTLFEIGKRLGLSRERIRQIEKIALNKIRKLKNPALKDYATV